MTYTYFLENTDKVMKAKANAFCNSTFVKFQTAVKLFIMAYLTDVNLVLKKITEAFDGHQNFM